MKHFVLVTGASSGIGESSCRLLIEAGYEVLAGVRREEDATRLMGDLGSKVHPLILDVTDQSSIEAARISAELIIRAGSLVSIINNAGIVVSGSVLHVPAAEWRRQFEVNVLGVVMTTQVFFNLLIPKENLKDNHPRRIINMSSISGLFASPFMGPYAASKYALEALSDSLRRELFMHDIQVVIIEPGGINTPIWTKAKDEEQYLGPDYEWLRQFKEKIIENNTANSLPVEKVSALVLNAVRATRVRNRYLIKAGLWKFNMIRKLPAKWVDRMIRKKLREKSNIRPF